MDDFGENKSFSLWLFALCGCLCLSRFFYFNLYGAKSASVQPLTRVCDSCLVICMNCTTIISGTDEQKFLRSALAAVFLVVLTHMPLESAWCGLLA